MTDLTRDYLFFKTDHVALIVVVHTKQINEEPSSQALRWILKYDSS